jgi:hypothetical protein
MLQGAELLNVIFLKFKFQFFYFKVTESSTNKRKHARNRILLKKIMLQGAATECNFLKFLISILLFQFHKGRRCRGY